MDPLEYNSSEYECFSYIEESSNPNILTNLYTIDYSDYSIQYFMYNSDKLNYLTNYIYPFWKQQFITKEMKDEIKDTFNPYASWSNTDLARYNMGLKDNTMCFQMMVSDVPIGFCSLLLLDQFDYTDRMSPFSNEIYKDSLVLYNLVIEKGFRGEGYGKSLLDGVLEYIGKKLQTYKFVTLYVDKDNTVAKLIYEKRGFVLIGDNSMNKEQDLYRLSL